MTNYEIIKNHIDHTHNEKKRGLDEILNIGVSLDTNIMDFFMIAGWDYCCGKIYKEANENTKRKLKIFVKARKKGLSNSIKIREGRFINTIRHERYKNSNLNTLGDLKYIFENKGVCFRGIRYKSVAHFNETLVQYGIKPFEMLTEKSRMRGLRNQYKLD